MTDSSDMLIFLLIVGARFLLPLTIPRYPLPGVVACLILDGVDQSIFQKYTSLPLEGYQGYDKALDIYYLTVAYLSTFRNWTTLLGFEISRFLYYYRLVGVVLFEWTQIRELLIIFPNTFEYFFIFVEAAYLRWDPRKMTRRALIGSAAFIWIFIKLPQEYWIHIAQLDTTDLIKEAFGYPPDAPFSEILAANMWLIPAAIAVVVLLFFLARWIYRRLPSPDWALTFSSDDHLASSGATAEATRFAGRVWDRRLLEKAAMITLVGFIFASLLEAQVTNLQLAVGVILITAVNAALSTWLARRGTEFGSMIRSFLVLGVVNFGLVLVYTRLLPSMSGDINEARALFFALLLTLMVVLFDRFEPAHRDRFASEG